MTYLDHAATAPMLGEAVAVMSNALCRTGNPSPLHSRRRAARRAAEESRELIAATLGAGPSEVVFTGGGTEGDKLAVKGIYWSPREVDPRRTRVLVSTTEHHAVLEVVDWLTRHQSAELELLGVDELGRVRPEAPRAALARAPERAK
jgi:cysteine desulfurase